VPILLQLVDANGKNFSSPSVVVHAVSLDNKTAVPVQLAAAGQHFYFIGDDIRAYAIVLNTLRVPPGDHTLSTEAGC
jgi:hypothetical protein